MSIRDSAGPAGPGNTGVGGIANGGVGGGWGAGGGGAGTARNGGAGSQTGMTTGKDWHGNSAFGQAGGNVQAYGMRDARSLAAAGMGPTRVTFGNFQTPSGNPMFGGSPVQGQSFTGMNMGQALSQAQRAQAAWAAQNRPQVGGEGAAAVPASGGILDPEVARPAPSFANNPFVNKPATLPAYVMGKVQAAMPSGFTNPPDYNPAQLQTYKSPYGPEMVGQWRSGIKDRWHDAYGASNPGYSGGYGVKR